MKMMSSAVKSCGFKMGEDVVFILDAGAGRLYRKEADNMIETIEKLYEVMKGRK